MPTPSQLPNNAIDFLTATLNSVGATKNLINQISTDSKGTQAERSLQLTGQALQSHQDQINQIIKYLRGVQFTLNNQTTPVVVSDTAVTLDGVTVTYGSPPVDAAQTTSDTKGDQLDVRMMGAKGDVVTVGDAVTHAGSPTVTSATAKFAAGDVGKIIIVAGAGTAGVAFQSTIKTVSGPTQVDMNANAVTAVTAADMSFGTDDTKAVQAGFQKHNCLFPEGRYFCDAPITLTDLNYLYFEGRGRATEILPTTSFTTQNFINIIGSSYIRFKDIVFDGRYFPDISQEIIIGDGSVKNPVYGDIQITGCEFYNCRPIVIGIGATTGNTVTNLTIERNRFYNCSWGSFLPNTIDTGSTGTKLNIKINYNVFEFANTSPGGAANSGTAIFAGHGTQTATEIIGNIILNAPIDAIQVYARPFSGEAVTVTGTQVKDNFINQPGWAGIALYGGFFNQCDGNTILNPGQKFDGAFEKRCGIYISNGVSGVSNQHNSNVHIANNTIIGDGAGMTINGIAESTGPGPGVVDAQGIITNNSIKGQSGLQNAVYGGLAIQEYDPTGSNGWAFGKADPTASALNVRENFQTQRATANLFNEVTVLPAQASGGFQLCYAFNAHFNGTNWVSGFDGSSNGFAIMAWDYGGGTLRFYTVPSTGGGAQILSPAALDPAFLSFVIGANQVIQIPGEVLDLLVFNASASSLLRVKQGAQAAGSDVFEVLDSGNVVRVAGRPNGQFYASDWIGAGTSSRTGTNAIDVAGNGEVAGTWAVGSLTPSANVRCDGSRNLTTGPVNLSNSGDVSATGVSAGQTLVWNGGNVIGVTGVNHTVPLAKLTVGGSNGSLIFTDGILIGGSDPT